MKHKKILSNNKRINLSWKKIFMDHIIFKDHGKSPIESLEAYLEENYLPPKKK